MLTRCPSTALTRAELCAARRRRRVAGLVTALAAAGLLAFMVWAITRISGSAPPRRADSADQPAALEHDDGRRLVAWPE